VNEVLISIGIRNSGTEAKTNISIRAMSEIDGLDDLAYSISEYLKEVLVHSSSSE
jgi:hypothetical protein